MFPIGEAVGEHALSEWLSTAAAFAVLSRNPTGYVFELTRKMTLRRKREIGAYCRNGLVGIGQQLLRFLDFFTHYVIGKVLPRLLLEARGQTGAAHIHRRRDVLRGDGLRNVVLHVIRNVHDKLGSVFSHVQFSDALCIVKHHVKLQIHKTFLAVHKFAFADVRIAECESVVDVHSSPDCSTGNKRCSNYEGVFELSEMI